MLKIAICDDDKYICAAVEGIVLAYSKECRVKIETEVFYSGEEFIQFITHKHTFDLIFLDIELGTTTGIEIGTKIRNERDDYISKIVFISARVGYERQLFDVQPLNFLEKPIDEAKVRRCIELVIKILDREKKIFNYQVGHCFKQVRIKDILYFESKLRKVRVVTVHGVEEFYSTLESIKVQLPNHFIIPHASYIVNYEYIQNMSCQDIVMWDGSSIPISRGKLKEIQRLQIQLIREFRNVNL